MIIGIDFDNTLAGYDRVFAAVAAGRFWVPAGGSVSKREVRDAVLGLPDGERKWMELQGEVYGPRMAGAELIEGASVFLMSCREAGVEVHVVSHKTVFGHFDLTATNLRQAALTWMEAQGFFDPARYGLNRERVHFEATRDDKLARIGALGCHLFIDDLEEVLADPAFAAGCRRIHLGGASGPFESYRNWAEIHDAVFSPG